MSARRLRWPPDRSSVLNSPSAKAGLVEQPELRQQPIDLAGIRIGNPIEPLEQVVINENRGNQRAIGIAVGVVDAHPVEQ